MGKGHVAPSRNYYSRYNKYCIDVFINNAKQNSMKDNYSNYQKFAENNRNEIMSIITLKQFFWRLQEK